MRIVILTQYFLPETGAPQSRLYETAVGLQKRGWEVLIVTAMPNYPTGSIFKEYRNKITHNDSVDNIKVNRYVLYPSNSSKKVPRILSMLSFSVTSWFSILRLRKFKPDYILTESPPLTLGLTGLLLSRMCGARHVLNVSDLWPLSAYKLGAISQGYLYRRLQALERYLYKTAYACTGQSQGIIDHLAANGAKRTNLYRNGVDVTRFNNIGSATRNGRLKIVYTGLLGLAQGILTLCMNIDFVSLDVEFHIYGDGPEKEAIAAYLQQKPNTHIFLNSFVSREAIPPLLAKFDLTLIPLIKPIYGAVPSKMYEAMAASLPILFAGGGEGEQMVKQHNLGWTSTPGNYNEMYHCIKAISQLDRKVLQVFKTNCREAAENVFDREQQLQQLHRFLTEGNNA